MLAQPTKARDSAQHTSAQIPDNGMWQMAVLLDVIFLLLQKHNGLITGKKKDLLFSCCHSLVLGMYQISPLWILLCCFLLNIFTITLCESRSVWWSEDQWELVLSCHPVGSVVQTQVIRDAGEYLSSLRLVESSMLETLSNLWNGPKHIIPHTSSMWHQRLSTDN